MRRLALAASLLACGRPPAATPRAGHAPEDMPEKTAPSPAPSPPASADIAEAPVPESMPSKPAPRERRPPPGLVDLRAALPGACFDIRYHTADNFTGAPLPGYGAPGAWLRARPADALARAQADLRRDGLTLTIYDAYRPARASAAMVAWADRAGRSDLVRDGYIARRSGHNRGDTIDVGLARAGTCEALDMGSAWDHLGPESNSERATGEALANRRRLRRALQAVGFAPYAKEWWHFTFAEPGAAALDVPYGESDPDAPAP